MAFKIKQSKSGNKPVPWRAYDVVRDVKGAEPLLVGVEKRGTGYRVGCPSDPELAKAVATAAPKSWKAVEKAILAYYETSPSWAVCFCPHCGQALPDGAFCWQHGPDGSLCDVACREEEEGEEGET